MTDTDIEIVKFDYEHEEKLCAEIAQNKSFVGTMASLAVFVALEWVATSPPKLLVLVVFGLLVASAVCFLSITRGKIYQTPGDPQNWIDSRTEYAHAPKPDTQTDDPDRTIKEMFYRRLLAYTNINREITATRQRRVELTGFLSATALIVTAIHSAVRYVFS